MLNRRSTAGPRRWPASVVRYVSLLCIGAVVATSQLSARLCAQVGEPPLGVVPTGDREFRERFRSWLVEVPSRDAASGWNLASALGSATLPLLAELYREERAHAETRLSVLVAMLLAAQSGEDPLALVGLRGGEVEDRVLTCLSLALGPRRIRPIEGFWPAALGRQREPVPVVRIAAMLAAERLIDGVPQAPPLALVDGEDPGLVAAAELAGIRVPASVVQRYWRFDAEPKRHADLVWRGSLLGALLHDDQGIAADVVDRARLVLLDPRPAFDAARGVAALVLSHAQAVEGLPDLPWQLRQLLASDPSAATRLRAILPPVPRAIEEESPGRLAVAYALSRDVEEVLAEHRVWSSHANVRREIALALARQICLQERPVAVEARVFGLPEWYFVQWASASARGEALPSPPPRGVMADPLLEQAVVLLDESRLDRQGLADVLEGALWCRGSHPGLGLWEEHRQLVRDLLIAGSLPGSKYLAAVPKHLRYLPKGLGNENPTFDVAVQLYDHLSRPALPIPEGCRLR
jgi:hypothetical protein